MALWNEYVISIHALLAESDTQYKHLLTNIMIFLSTLSLRRATVAPTAATAGGHNFYPRSPCGERHTQNFTALYNIFISIHALLAESDLSTIIRSPSLTISIHALLAESDVPGLFVCGNADIFLSTLSLRRATRGACSRIRATRISIHALLAESDSPSSSALWQSRHFYPRSPCGERLPG